MISPQLLAHVRHSEGVRLVPYKDVAGHWTCGVGHLMGRDPHPGEVWSQEQVEETLAKDLEQAQRQATALCPSLTNQPRLDALTDLVFNLGSATVRGSGTVAAFNRGDWPEAARRFRLWNKARVDGQLVEVKGLVTRRNALAPWVETGAYS